MQKPRSPPSAPGEEFSAKRQVGAVRWMENHGAEKCWANCWAAKERKLLFCPMCKEQSQCSVAVAELKEGQTTPPKHFTEDTLLHAMETASADSMPEGVERQGIGTPATRAATIEKAGAEGLSGAERQQENQGTAAHRQGQSPHHRDARRNPIPGNDRRLGNESCCKSNVAKWSRANL